MIKKLQTISNIDNANLKHWFYLISLLFSFQPLQIKSVISKESLKGYIYIESYKQTHVKQAIEGIGNLRMGIWAQQVHILFLTRSRNMPINAQQLVKFTSEIISWFYTLYTGGLGDNVN